MAMRQPNTASAERRDHAFAFESSDARLEGAGLLDESAYFMYVWTRRGGRDLACDELWEESRMRARLRREALAQRPALPQARSAAASLVVAAVTAAAPAATLAHSGSKRTASSSARDAFLSAGSRGPDVAAIQRALGISADGIFGPQTRAAVRAFQAQHGLTVDGIVGPRTRAALRSHNAGSGGKLYFRAPWVAPVQRALGIPADGIFGPQTRAAVRAYQARHGLVVDGIVGPQTLGHLGLTARSAAPKQSHTHSHSNGGGSTGGRSVSGPGSITPSLWDELALARNMGLRLVSGHRPGATIGGSGGGSDHSYYPSRAIDVAGTAANMRRFALAVAGRSGIKYVIYSPLGMWGSWSGRWEGIDSAVTRANHYSHVHVSGYAG